ncbi:uncharacterized protein MONBRDRAFT_38621 [Monosiga brevicollis MX1]|uniref:Nodulin-like domain-containing protein n=1 Tax=Monosiga brevicollis TaxID=81824 RepID=A9V968_MONBE|nr:uncharacterized protein MONBRDRAFT_38621 [Monosiga brevicollis MX1]EDQ86006.1 predicted protein [Monosiga brevicollis MX1]|eukprot:XP_001749200.1 hypothetical protein [Monosiga brevicollis MX1]
MVKTQVNRWLIMATGMLMMTVAGTIYLYPDYATALRGQLNFSIAESARIGTLLNLGAWMTVIGGIFYDRFGPLRTGLIGAVTTFVGYFLMFLAAQERIIHTWIAVGFYAFIMGQGSGWMYCVALNTSVQNFPARNRGKIVGLLACCFGLCSGIFTRLHAGFFSESDGSNGGDIAPFLFFLAVTTGGLGLAYTFFQQILTETTVTQKPAEARRVAAAYAIALAVATYIAASSISAAFSSHDDSRPLAVGLIVLVFSLLLLPVGSGPWLRFGRQAQYTRLADDHEHHAADTHKLPPSINVTATSNAPTKTHYTLLEAVTSLDFWLIFLVLFFGVGAGICIVNNLPEIVISRLPPSEAGRVIASSDVPHSKDSSTLVALFSVFNTCGRLLSGYLSDAFAHRISRLGFLVMGSLLMGAVQVYFMFTSIDGMYGAVVLLGIAYGSFFCLVPALVSEAFGMATFGATFGLQGLAPAAGSEVFGTAIAGRLADSYANHAHLTVITKSGDKVIHCIGAECFRYSLLCTAGGCLIGAGLALWMAYRQRRGTANTLKLHAS